MRLVVATTDPAALPEQSTWYLATNLPRPGSPRAADRPHPPAELAELVWLYGIRNWIEQRDKQVKDELGWADFQVRSDVAIRRHQTLVNCAFSFCWHAFCWHAFCWHAFCWHATHPLVDPRPAEGHPPPAAHTDHRPGPGPDPDPDPDPDPGPGPGPGPDPVAANPVPVAGATARGAHPRPPSAAEPRRLVADRAAPGARLAGPVAVAATLVAGLLDQPAAPAPAGTARLDRSGQAPEPLPSTLN